MSTSMNKTSVIELKQAVSAFFPKHQLKLLVDIIFDHEAEDWQQDSRYFIDILQQFAKTFEAMPKTYDTEPNETVETDESNNNFAHTGEAIVHLHYFSPGCDWWIIEKDINPDQTQAFGAVSINGYSVEFGYIDLRVLIDMALVELDFHWQPIKLKDIPELATLFINQHADDN